MAVRTDKHQLNGHMQQSGPVEMTLMHRGKLQKKSLHLNGSLSSAAALPGSLSGGTAPSHLSCCDLCVRSQRRPLLQLLYCQG